MKQSDKKSLIKKTQKRGPADDRLNDIELGFAYILSSALNPQYQKNYEDLQIVYEYDRIAAEDVTTSNRCMRAIKAYVEVRKRNQQNKPGRKVDLSKYDNGKVYSVSDPLFESINRGMERNRNKLRKFIKENNDILKIDDTFDKEKIIHLVLDTYPDPIFFSTNENLLDKEWDAELMKQIFGNGEDENFFFISAPFGGIIPISTLPYDNSDYENAINSYIEKSSWKFVRENNLYNNDKIRVFNIDLERIPKRIKRSESPSGCCSWGEYQILIDGRSEKIRQQSTGDCIRLEMRAPKYVMYEVDFVENEIYDSDNAHRFVNYPLLLFENFNYKYQIADSYDKNIAYYQENISRFVNRLYTEIENKRWSGKSIKIKDEDLILPYQFAWDNEITYLFVMKPTVRNAKIIKDLLKLRQ